MYENVSDEFITAINGNGRTFLSRITIGGEVITDIKSYTHVAGSCGSEVFSFGSVFASYITLTIPSTDSPLANREMYLETGIMLEDGAIEYIPMGYYTALPSDIAISRDQIILKASDRITSKCNGFFSASVAFPATIQAVIEDLEDQAGISVKTSFDTSGIIDTKLPMMLCSEALGYLAGLLGGFCFADRTGVIRIEPFPIKGIQIDKDRISSLSVNGSEYLLDAISVIVSEGGEDANGEEVETVSFAAGTGEGVTISNPYMTQALFDKLSERLLGYTFYPGTVSFLGDPRLDPDDAIYAVNYADKEFFIPCMSLTQTFDGGLSTTVSAPGLAVSDQAAQGPLSQQVERLATDMVLAKQVIAKTIMAYSAFFTNVTVSEDLTVTGELVGVRIRGDTLHGNTVYADALVLKGSDGLYYQINADAGNLTHEQLSDEKYGKQLDGSVIIAQSVTAEQINVRDLFAQDILFTGKFYTAEKESVDSTGAGIYMDHLGQFATGNNYNFIASWYDTEADKWKIAIRADEISFGTGQSVTEVITNAAAIVYDHTYVMEGTLATFTAIVREGKTEVTRDYPPECYTWYLKTEDGTDYLGSGYTITVDTAACGYGAEVVGKFTETFDDPLLDSSGNELETEDGGTLTGRTESEGRIKVTELPVRNPVITDKLIGIGEQQEYQLTIESLKELIGGPIDYSDLQGKPLIEGVELVNDRSFEELQLSSISNSELENMLIL